MLFGKTWPFHLTVLPLIFPIYRMPCSKKIVYPIKCSDFSLQAPEVVLLG